VYVNEDDSTQVVLTLLQCRESDTHSTQYVDSVVVEVRMLAHEYASLQLQEGSQWAVLKMVPGRMKPTLYFTSYFNKLLPI
jgi:hypothetical protein